MLGKDIQINSRQLRMLVVLMLLLPLLPIGIMTRFMVHSVVVDREDAIEASKRLHLSELQRTTNLIAVAIGKGEMPRVGADDVLGLEPLAEVYRTIFGPMLTIRLRNPEGDIVLEDRGRAENGEAVSVSMQGVLEGWRAELVGVGFEFSGAEFYGQLLYALRTPLLVTGVVLLITFLAARTVTRQLRLDELRSDFLATIGHELKTPLASSQVLLETLAAGSVPDAEAEAEYYELLLKENDRLGQLVQNFLTFHRLEQSREFEKEEVSPTGAVEEAMAISGPRAEKLGGRVMLLERVGGDEPGEASTLMADRSALVTALVCLIENGLKYSNGEPLVEVGCSLDEGGEEVLFKVMDRGIGISREAGDRIFERFYQGEAGLNRTHGGCGLGLAIAQAIAEGHGGSISHECRKGGGTTFTMRIPCG
jgi:signal transduction histidine kinase